MNRRKHQVVVFALALAGTLGGGAFSVYADDDSNVKKVFVIAMENHNWTQPPSVTSPQQISGNPAAPFINSLVNGTSGISDQVAYATNYINAGINLGLHVHPSEPNYVWAPKPARLSTRLEPTPTLPGPHTPYLHPEHGHDERSAPDRLSGESAQNVEGVSGRRQCGFDRQRSAADEFLDLSAVQP